MKTWMNPSVEEISLANTEHKWLGCYRDGGYIGDGQISGHVQWEKPTCPIEPSPLS